MLHCHNHLTRLEPAASGLNADGNKGPAGGGRGLKQSDKAQRVVSQHDVSTLQLSFPFSCPDDDMTYEPLLQEEKLSLPLSSAALTVGMARTIDC